MEENNKDVYQPDNNSNPQDGLQTDVVNTTAQQQNQAAQQGNDEQQSRTAQQSENTQYEQRPSQLYGRTAYQQRNQANAQNNNQYGNPNGNPNGYQNNNQYGNPNGYQSNNQYGNPNGYQNNNQYGNPNGYQNNNPYGNANGYQNNYQYNNAYNSQNQPVHGKVSNVFCYILLVIMPLSNIISMMMYNMVFGLMEGLSYEELYTEYVERVMELATAPGYMTLSMLTYALSIGFIVFVILDIVKVHKQNYKITGLILFAIFLKPGYYLWRAHVLGEKKTIPVLYTIGHSVLILTQIVMMVAKVMSISMTMVEGMY